TGSGEVFNVGQFLEETSPYMWASMGICLLNRIPCSWSRVVHMLAPTTHACFVLIDHIIFFEVMAIYSVIMGVVCSSKVIMTKESLLYTRETILLVCYALFWCGWTMSLCNLLCGISVGITGLMVALADAMDPGLFMKVLIVKMFG
ncbi:hypothetical protein EI94DRAFT_1579011, partial [Lactarius quietus]